MRINWKMVKKIALKFLMIFGFLIAYMAHLFAQFSYRLFQNIRKSNQEQEWREFKRDGRDPEDRDPLT